MSKRWLIAAAVVLLGVVALLVWQSSEPPEPMFEGRPLSSWMDHHVASSAASPPYNSPGWHKAHEAIRTIGTNCIPTLLRMISAKDLPLPVIKLLQNAQRYRWMRINYRYKISQNEEAEYAFEILGTNGVSAVPGLIKIYEDNVSPSSQRCAALALGHIGRGAQAALPVLIHDFTHSNSDVRFYDVSAVTSIGGDPDGVIPALTGALKDSNVSVRWNALSGLDRFGPRARSAVPEILKMLSDPGVVGGGTSITQQVMTALWRIAPEKIGQPLVVEEATPLITNGVTAEAVKFLFHGQRQILVPAGEPVPCLGQYWNSDPRPRLTMYRGASAADGQELLLGEFEVLDVEPVANVNISTLCIIADGKIYLNAFDNTRNRLLAIRRIENSTVK